MDESLIVPVSLFIAAAYTIVSVARTVAESRTRRRLIEAGLTSEVARALTSAAGRDAELHGALKWGLVMLALGVALIVVQFIPFRPGEPIAFGIVLVFVALGLLAYFALGRRMGRERTAAAVTS
jgi:hypothetical protein